jgi:hypothetical protein
MILEATRASTRTQMGAQEHPIISMIPHKEARGMASAARGYLNSSRADHGAVEAGKPHPRAVTASGIERA